MDLGLLNILEFFLFFVVFAVVFQAFNALHIEKYFKKGQIWQIQIIYIFSTIIFTYLTVKALMNLIYLSLSIFS